VSLLVFDQAIGLALGLAWPLGSESVPVEKASGRVLAAPVIARADAPQTPVSTMDGYAVRETDLAEIPARLKIVGEVFPGTGFDGEVASGACVRIFTGGPLPTDCDRVVIQEIVHREDDEAVFHTAPGPGRNVRAQGSDFRAGETLLDAGLVLGPQAMVAAGAADFARLEVVRRPRVAILATGDELVAPGQAHARPGTIPDSASLGVAALVEAWGGEIVSRLRVPDDRPALEQAAAQALSEADLVVVIGGASVGEKDFAKAMFEPHGLELVFSKVAIKPGKPVWLGLAGERLVLGLPGNPGSALVTARLFLAPLLAGLGGRGADTGLVWTRTPLAAPLIATGDRETFHRARSSPEGAVLIENQDSGAQKALAQADLLIRRRAGAPACAKGETVEALRF
jgi:molybdopterin molybdotransferase